MKRGKGEESSNSTDRISELPQGILQRILYFLTQEEAVRTSVLSKSWRYIWCTRPNLDFSNPTFKEDFLSVVDKTLRRYCDQRLCVEEFQLRMILLGEYSDHESVSLLEKWIAVLRNMGTTKFCLSIRLRHVRRRRPVELPSVVFGAESLRYLHVERFKLDKETIRRIVLFKHLKTVSLQRVLIKDEVFEKIISCCPLIKTLDVGECKRLKTIKVNDLHNLKDFAFSADVDTAAEQLCSIEILPPSIKIIFIRKANICFHKGADNFRNLKCLSLWFVKSSLEHLSSCKFPSLVYLKIAFCGGLKRIQLFIDAPNIKRFQYAGLFVPSICFATTSSEWVSLIHLSYRYHNDTLSSWFLKLHELLKSLSQSEITLTITKCQRDDEDVIQEDVIQENVNPVQDNNGRNKPVVVKALRLGCHLWSNSSILDAFFCICRPRSIGHNHHGREREMEFTECRDKILKQLVRSAELWEVDLEEVSMEIYDKNRKEWHPVTPSELPNYQQREHKIVACFPLKWRQT